MGRVEGGLGDTYLGTTKDDASHSFELHPSLLLDDLLTDLDLNDDDDEDMDFMALLDDVDMDFMALLEMLQQ